MPIWIIMLITIAGWLLQWLLTRQKDRLLLTDKQKVKVDSFIHIAHKIEEVAVPLGATPGGRPEPVQERKSVFKRLYHWFFPES